MESKGEVSPTHVGQDDDPLSNSRYSQVIQNSVLAVVFDEIL